MGQAAVRRRRPRALRAQPQDQKLIFAPGERFQYSNIAYEILGDAVAKASGVTFEEHVHRNILQPLGMSKSTLLVTEADPALMTWGHELDGRGRPFVSTVYPYNRMHTPSSDLHSNVQDMRAGPSRTSTAARSTASASSRPTPARRCGRPSRDHRGGPDVRRQAIGLSWFLGQHRGRRIVSHGGGDTGYITDLVLVPEGRKAVVWMANVDYIGRPPLTRAALDAALGLTPSPSSQSAQRAASSLPHIASAVWTRRSPSTPT